jgi:AcrR family transcriptional regulator
MDDEHPASKIGRPPRISGEKPTKEKIFEASLDLFADQGYDRTSVRRIAKTVGLTEGAVYRHYPSKESILEAILAYAESQVFAPLPDTQEGESQGSIFWRLLIVPLDAIIADPYLIKIMRVLYAEMHHNEKIHRYFQKEFVERADDMLEALFKDAIERGSVRACDPRALAVVFNSFRSEWAFQNFIVKHGEPIDAEKIKNDLKAPVHFFENLLMSGKNAP